jgi:hypothetical protein
VKDEGSWCLFLTQINNLTLSICKPEREEVGREWTWEDNIKMGLKDAD